MNTTSSNKKADKEAKKTKKNESEVAEEENIKVDENENIYKEEEPVQVEEQVEKKYSIEKIYFKVYQNENADDIKNRYSIDYLFSFRNWKICNETKLIEDLVEGHIKDMKETVEEVSTQKHQRGGDIKNGFGKRPTKFSRDETVQQPRVTESLPFQRSKIDLKPPEPKENQPTETGEGLGKWGRKDLSKEEQLAKDFKSRREEEVKKDPIRFKLTEYIFK